MIRGRLKRFIAYVMVFVLIAGLVLIDGHNNKADAGYETEKESILATDTDAESEDLGHDDIIDTSEALPSDDEQENKEENVYGKEEAKEPVDDEVERVEPEYNNDNAQSQDNKDNTESTEDSSEEKTEAEAADDNEVMPYFSQEKTIDGVTVRVTAEEGTFLDGAYLVVKKVSSDVLNEIDEAVEEKRGNVNVAVSYTFDIKVIGRDGMEIQPADGKSVQVSFSVAENTNENLDTSVYHIEDDDLHAEKLAIDVSGDTATAYTDGFSYYTVEFTYNEKQYVMEGDSTVALTDILSFVGITGTDGNVAKDSDITSVSVSDESLFTASNTSGKWMVTAHQAFHTNEWMKVTVDGVEYEIVVTDATTYTTSQSGLGWNDGDIFVCNGSTYEFNKSGTGYFVYIKKIDGQTSEYHENRSAKIEGTTITVYSDENVTFSLPSGYNAWQLNVVYDDGDYNCGFTPVNVVLTVDPTYVVSGNTYTYSGSSKNLVTTSGEGGTIYYRYKKSTNSSYSSWQTSIPTATDAGTYNIQWYSDGDSTYNAKGSSTSPAGTVNATINKADNPLSYTSTQSVTKSYSTSLQTASLTAATNNQGTLSYAINSQKDSSNATVSYFSLSGTTLNIAANTPAGTYKVIVRASADGNSNYESGSIDSTVTVTISKVASTTPTLTAYTGTYDGSEHTVTVSGGSGGTIKYSTDNTNWTTTKPARKDYGTTKVYAKVFGDGNHNDSSIVSADITINKKEVGLNWSNTTFTYDGDAHIPTATASELIGSDICSVTVTGEKIDAGTYTATASNLSNDNYKLPSEVTTSFTINKCETTITIEVSDMIYTGEELNPVPKVTADNNGNKVIPDSEYTCHYTDNINEGTATITITNKTNGNYEITENLKTFTVIPKSIANDNTETTDNKSSLKSVSIEDFPDVVYSGEEQMPETTIKYNGMTLKEGRDYVLTYIDNLNAGTATVTVTGQGNYKGTVTKTFTIAPLPLTESAENFILALDGSSYVYNGQPQTPAVTLTRGDGTEQKKLTLVEGTDYEITYKNSNTDGRAKNSNEYDTKDTNAVDAGTITVRVTGKSNYSGYLEKTYTITRREAEVYGLIAIDKIYDGNTTIALDSTNASLHNLVAGDEDYVSVSTSATGEAESADVGTDIKVNIKDAELSGDYAGNYTLTSVNPVLVDITKRELEDEMVSLAYERITYDGTEKEPVVNLTDMVDGVNIIGASDCEIVYEDNVHAGTATVTVTATDAGNYSGSVTKTFTIEKAEVTLTAENKTSAHGADIKELTYVVDDNLDSIYDGDLAGLNIKLDTTANRKSAVGTYPITISYTANDDYDITAVDGTYTITKGLIDDNVNITVKNETVVYNGENHSATVTASGVSASDVFTIYYSTESAEDAQAKAESEDENVREAAKIVPSFKDAGTYTVYAYVISDSYEGGKSATAKVTILKAPLTVTAKDRTVTYGYEVPVDTDTLANVTIEGLVDSDSAVTESFSVTVNYNTSYVQYSDVGTYTIRPEIEDDSTHEVFKNYDITYATGTLTVNPKVLTDEDFTWTPDTHTFTYDGTAKGLTATVTVLNNDDVVVSEYEGNSNINVNAEGEHYTASVVSIGGSKAGNYSYDRTAGEASCEYTITKAENSWVVEPAIQAEIPEGATYEPVGKAKFGETVFTYYTDVDCTTKTTIDETGSGAATEGGKPTKQGAYYLKATGTSTDNYDAPEEKKIGFEIVAANESKTIIYVTGIAKNTNGDKLTSITYGDTAPAYGYELATGASITLSEDDETTIKSYLDANIAVTSNYDTENANQRGVGAYTVIPALKSETAGTKPENYEFVFNAGEFTVEKRTLTVKWPTPNEFVYTGSDITYTATLDGIVSGDDVTIGSYVNDDTYKNVATAVGAYTAKVDTTGLTGSAAANYRLDDTAEGNTATWRIVAADNEITGLSVSDWYYGEPAISPVATAKYGEVQFKYVNKDDTDWANEILWPVTGSDGLPTAVGTYKIYAYVEEGSNYNAVATNKENAPTFTIHPAEIAITADNKESNYGADIVTPLTGSYTVVKGELTNEEKTELESHITYTTTATSASSVGTYPITASYDDTADYIKATSVDGTYTIKGNTAQVSTADGENGDVILTYDGKEHGINAPVLKDGEDETIDADLYKVYYSASQLTDANYNTVGTTSSPTFKNAGEHTVYYYIVSEEYTPVTGSAKVTINKAPLTVTAKDKEIAYNTPAENDGVTYDGFVNGETESVLTGALTYSYKAKAADGTVTANEYAAGFANGKAGEYAIVPAGLTSDNYEITYENGTMTVTAGMLDESYFESITEQIYEADESGNGVAKTPDVTIKSDCASYVSTDDYTVTYENNVDAGTAYAVLTPTASGNFAGSAVVKIPFTIGKKAVTIKAEDKESTYGTELKELTYQVTIGSLNDAEKALLNIGVETAAMTGSNAGTYDINITYTENPNYEVTTEKGIYTITPAGIMTAVATGVDVVYDGQEHSGTVEPKVAALPNNNATVYYSSTDELTADNYISKGSTDVPVFKNVTETDVTVYYYVVSNNFEPVSGSYNVRITPATLTVTPKDVANVTYGDAAPDFTGYDKTETYLTYEGFVADDAYENAVTGTPVFATTYTQGSDVGDYEITVSGLTAENYNIVFNKGELTVGKKNVTLDWAVDTGAGHGTVSEDNPAVPYTGKSVTMPMKATSTGLYSGDEAKLDIAYTGNSGTVVGTYTAEVTGVSGEKAGNYIFTLPSDKTWEITKASNTVSDVTITDWTEGQPAPTPYAEAKFAAAGEPTYKYYTRSGEEGNYTYTETTIGTEEGQSGAQEAGGQPTKAGTYYVKAYVAETGNYGAAESTNYKKFTINPSNDAVTTIYVIANDKQITYGDAVPEFADTSDYTLKKAVKNTETGEYEPADLDNTETLATIAGTDATVTFTTTYTQGSDVGAYTIVPSGLTAQDGYEIIYEPGTLTVSKKEVTLTWDYTEPYDYSGKAQSVNASVTSTDIYDTDDLSVVYAESGTEPDETYVREATNVGNYKAKVASLSGAKAGNYTLAAGAQTELDWEIKKASTGEGANTITASIAGWTYGDTPSTPTVEVKYGSADDVTYTYYTDSSCNQVTTSANGATSDGALPVKAGTYYMKAAAAGSDNYEEVTSEAVSFTIAQRPVTIVASDITAGVGEELQTLTYNSEVILDIDGDETKDAVTVALSTTANKDKVGTYPITVGDITGDDAANYTFTKVNGTYTVSKSSEAVSITVTPYSGTYDGAVHDGITEIGGTDASAVTMYYSTEHELTETNYATGTKVMPKFKDAGSYRVYYYAVSDTKTGTGGDVTVTINKKSVTMTAADMSIVYGDAVPATDEVTYTGVVDGESITGETFAFDYNQYVDVGIYDITPSIPNVETAYPNYEITAVNGKLTVSQKPLTFSWSKDAFFYDEAEHTITATPANKAQDSDDVVVATYEDNEKTDVGDYTAKVLTISGEKADNYYIKDDEASNTHAWKIAAGSNSFTTALSINGWTYGETPNAPVCASLYGEPSYTYYSDLTCTTMTGETDGAVEEGGVPAHPGIYFIKAKVPAGDGYEALESEAVPFTIAKAKLIITPAEQYGAVGAVLNELTYTITGGVVGTDTVTATLATTATADSPTGNYDITVSKVTVNSTDYDVTGTEVAENPLYEITVGTAKYHLADYGLTVKVSDDTDVWTKTYDGNEYGVKAELTASSGSTTPDYKMYYSTKKYIADELTTALNRGQVSEESPKIQNVGTLTVWFYAVGTDGSLLAYGNRTITIEQKSIADAVITLAADVFDFTGEEIKPDVTSVVLGDVTLVKDRDYTISYEHNINPGSPESDNPPIVVIKGKGNYKDDASKTFTIAGLDSDYTTEPAVTLNELVYNKEEQTLITAGTTEDGTILYSTDYDGTNFDTATWQEEVPKEVNAGAYKVSYYIKGSLGHKNTVPKSLDIEILKKDIAVKAVDTERAFGTANPIFKYEAEGMYEGDELTGELSCEADENSEPGEYDITKGTLENENYNIVEFESGTLTVIKLPPEIVTNPAVEVLPEKASISANVSNYRESDGDICFRYGTDKEQLTSKIAADKLIDVEELFVAEIADIEADTVYYYQAYIADGETEVATGEIMSFIYTDSSSDSEFSVEVYNETGDTTYVIITVEAGNDAVASSGIVMIDAEERASVTFDGLTDGEYNVVARTVDGNYTETRLITIKDGSAGNVTFTILKGGISTVVDVKTEDTPKVAVNGLPEIITDEEKEAAADGSESIKVELDVEKVDADSTAGAADIKALLSEDEEIKLLLDISLFKIVRELDGLGRVTSEDESNIGETNTIVLEIAVPFDTTEGNINAYKYHSRRASKLTRLSSRTTAGAYIDGTYYVGEGHVYIYSSEFSLYAIAVEMIEEPEDPEEPKNPEKPEKPEKPDSEPPTTDNPSEKPTTNTVDDPVKVEIPDVKVDTPAETDNKKADTTDKSVDTGDNTRVATAFILMIASFLAGVYLTIKKKYLRKYIRK